MAYLQNQQNQFEFDLSNTNNTTYEDQPLVYHNSNPHNRSLISPAPDPQMMSHGVPRSQYRKDSFASSAGVLSPISSMPGWEAKFASHSSGQAGAMPPHGFRFDSNPFVPHDSNTYFNNGRYLAEHSDSNTPAMFDAMATTKFEPPQYPQSACEESHPSPPTFTPIQQEPNFKAALQVQTPMSPHSQEEWKTWTELEKQGRAFPTHVRISNSPKYVEKRRGDGVRKKNAKIDIPDGLNVQVIEKLMATEQNESMLKELKGQKRLLRNREAALASRQRKKKHTEDLEERVSELNAVITNLEGQLQEYSVRLETEVAQRNFFEHRLHEADMTIEGLRQEKEHMVVQHTQTTSNLRQRIRALEDPVLSPAPAMSLAPSSTGYTDINSDLDHFNMNGPDWGDNIRLFSSEQDWELISGECPSEATIQPSKLMPASMQTDQHKATESKDIPTKILLMLLLCGAFVATNSTSKTPVIPRMSDEVRAFSDQVLNGLLGDVDTEAAPTMTNQYNINFTDPSTTGWPSYLSENSTIANMHRQLTSPSRRQLAEQASMLTPEQYNSLTQPQFTNQSMNANANPPVKRNLAGILSTMRRDNIIKGRTAAVYTRSLLWDQVPDHVAEQFKQAVREGEQISGTFNSVGSEPSSRSQDYNLRTQ